MSDGTGASPRAWQALRDTHTATQDQTIRDLFRDDASRFDAFSCQGGDLLFDYSKQRLPRAGVDALIALAQSARLEQAREAMFSGFPINTTERRPARHAALRAPRSVETFADVSGDVHAVLDRFLTFADNVRDGRITAADDKRFTDVINIGIGGSDLGPKLATEALAPYHDGPRIHFVSNVDGAHISDVTAKLDPARTLIVVASKSFTTLETMMNAQTARRWLVSTCGEEAVGRHFAALSTNLDAVKKFGISTERAFGFWDWVGGRYSLWSAIGLSVAIAIGPRRFRDLLAGAHTMDVHFHSAPLDQNLPALAGLIGIWNRNCERHAAHTILPYDERLARLPTLIQQIDMESNGKRVAQDGGPISEDTAPIIWGAAGTDAQHAFFQMLHQGTTIVPCDFLIAAEAHETGRDIASHHDALLANCFAQSEALGLGETESEARARMLKAGVDAAEADRLARHKTFPGNRPSSTLLYPKLTPSTLGQIIAFYEHKVFTQATVWGINAFDQWGVQLGKLLADELTPMIAGGPVYTDRNASTAGLIAKARTMRNGT